MGQFWRSSQHSESRRGWIATQWSRLPRLWGRIDNFLFDWRHGTETAAEVLLRDAGVSAEAGRQGNDVYRPLLAAHFRAALKSVPVDPRAFSFVDLGSGKGKLLLLAAEFPFRRIIGVEYAARLHDVAVHNIAIYTRKRIQCGTIEATLGDARALELPQGPVVAMIFNAFDGETTVAVLRNLAAQSLDKTQPVFVVYVNQRDVAEREAELEGHLPFTVLQRTRHVITLGNAAASKLWRSGQASAIPV